ncbi:MAG: carcinine hydrolase/isopenicillin-N N-acyltransferase family protein [Candidatus Hodarchaeales archaeon]|jgi:hypothetical protein
MMTKKIIIVKVLILLPMMICCSSALASSGFMASYGNKVLVGQNSDGDQEEYMYLFFHPASPGKHGYLAIRFDFDHTPNPNEELVNHAGMNDQGLVIVPTSIPSRKLNAHPEKPMLNDTYLNTLLSTVSTVDQAIAVLDDYQPHAPDFDDFEWQLLITDKTGEAVSLSVGPDGEFHISRKDGNYKVITNFNVAEPSLGRYPDPRYDSATNRLEKIDSEDDFSVDCFQSVLDAIHWEGPDTNTIYSNIYDPVNGLVYLYYFHQFDEVVVVNLEEELAKGYHYYNYRALFSPDTVEKAAQEKEFNQTLITGIMVVTLIVIALFVILLGFGIYKTGKKRDLATRWKIVRIGAFLVGGFLGSPLLYWNGEYLAVLLSSNYFEVSDGHQPFKELMPTIDLLVIGCAIIAFLVIFLSRYSQKFLKRV